MKKFYKGLVLSILCAFVLSVNNVQAQEPLQEVVHYIRGGNVSGMAKYLDKNVAITINNNQASYSSSQAEIILKDFFSKNVVKEFNVNQGRNTGNNSQYGIGELMTSTGSYQLYVVIKLNQDQFLIREMRFEKIEQPAR
ncbi:MAG: DUF4783 domain-containing protein [Chitinophagaceae bacterium]|nr:DUF4783 domain-containing protein [Chitinophagaceae bacterium]